ncbi:MAG TPA: M13 family metallopeptidase [Longimicrobium sp.]|nr:M13 family metallopeptidase [Longimicrobium sp.]
MTSLKNVLAPTCVLVLCGACATAPAPQATPTGSVETAPAPTTATFASNTGGIDRRNLDETARACVDFYQYANGGWLSRNTIPADRSSWTTGSELVARNDELLHRLMEEAAAAGAPRGSVKQKVGDLYASAMDTMRLAQLGAQPIQADLARIDALRNTDDLQSLLVSYHANGLSPLFGAGVEGDLANSSVIMLYVVQGGLGLPEKDYYLRDDERSVQLRRQYVEHVANMLALAGASPDAARAQADRVMAMETRLARVSLGAVELRNPANFYNPTTPAQADSLTPHFSWTRYLQGIGVRAERFSFPHRTFFAEVERMMTDVPMEDWKAYLRWNLVRGSAAYLSPDFERESFRFYSTVLQGTPQMEPRWKRARATVDGLVGEALGQLYVAEAFPPEAKARAMQMIDDIRAGLADRLRTLEWMSPATRERALAKLATFDPKIGYPDRWRDYSALEIDRGDYFGNVRRGSAFEARRQFARVGQPMDRNEWGMTPQTVNAYYNPLRNEVVFPAGIMQPPFFDPTADDAVNYGAMGAIIGHEIMHGFDDQGAQFDAQGNFSDWWTPEDKAEFGRRSQMLVDQYAEYVAVDSLHVNGRLTLGENIGDLGGLIVAYAGLQRRLGDGPRTQIDGFTPEQRFFLAFAQAWRGIARDEAVRVQVQTDPHSPRRFRAIGPVANMPEFARAFGCQPGDPMIRQTPVRIW